MLMIDENTGSNGQSDRWHCNITEQRQLVSHHIITLSISLNTFVGFGFFFNFRNKNFKMTMFVISSV